MRWKRRSAHILCIKDVLSRKQIGSESDVMRPSRMNKVSVCGSESISACGDYMARRRSGPYSLERIGGVGGKGGGNSNLGQEKTEFLRPFRMIRMIILSWQLTSNLVKKKNWYPTQ